MLGSTVTTIKDLQLVQHMLVQLANNAVVANQNPGKHKQFENLENVGREALALTRRVIKHGTWPDHLDPMPLVRNTLAGLYLNKGDHLAALRNSLRGTLMCRYRTGPEWVNNLCTLTRCLAACAAGDPDEPVFTSGNFLTLKETQCAVRGYGMRLCRDAGAVFGGASKYTLFLCDWFSWVVKTAGPPVPGTPEFEAAFWEVQKKLLAWADVDLAYCVDPGSAMPEVEDVTKKLGKLRMVGSNEDLNAGSDDDETDGNGADGDDGA